MDHPLKLSFSAVILLVMARISLCTVLSLICLYTVTRVMISFRHHDWQINLGL